MKTIKFSHRYNKIPIGINSGDTVVLKEVLNSKFEDLHQSFIDYDTTTKENEKYNLPKRGDCLVLILGNAYIIFTTVRRFTPEKEKYYKNLRGQQLKLIIENDTILATSLF